MTVQDLHRKKVYCNVRRLCKIYEVNEEQARALDIHLNTALRAGAGSGKTRVLTKRFVRCLLENPTLTLDNIAAITFTRKAATEMRTGFEGSFLIEFKDY